LNGVSDSSSVKRGPSLHKSFFYFPPFFSRSISTACLVAILTNITMAAPPSSATTSAPELPKVDIKPLLSRLWPLGHADPVTADEIAQAISYFFTNQVSDVQASSLLIALHFTGLDRHADVLAKTAAAMLVAAAKVDVEELRNTISSPSRKEGAYQGGLVRPIPCPPPPPPPHP
jgi:hypothetical protein